MACHRDFRFGVSFNEKLNSLLNYKKCLSENVLFPTGDSAKDGITIFNDIAQSIESDSSAIYWNIDLVDNVTGNAFENIIANLYSLMYEGYMVKRTSHNNDNGADIVVISETTKNGFLIKCNHKENFAEDVIKDAMDKKVKIIVRNELKNMLIKYRVSKF